MPEMLCQSSAFGELPDGQEIHQYTLRNLSGMSIRVMDYGATLTSVKIPDSRGTMHELVLGFDQLREYLDHDFYFGATIGRVANRIANARFNYQGHDYCLSKNEGHTHLHGGEQGFDKVVWQSKPGTQDDNSVSVTFSYISPQGDQGYPGILNVKTTYSLTSDNELKLLFEATTDQATPVDLTNHTYWNLVGAGCDTVLDHVLQVPADNYIVTSKEKLATGEIATVEGTPFDFRKPHRIGERLTDVPEGYDLCFVLSLIADHKPNLAAQIKEPVSGRTLIVYTTQPGLQFYTGNKLKSFPIANGLHTQRYGGFCMETQNFPGAVHYPQFPSPFLLPGNTYRHETIYKLIW